MTIADISHDGQGQPVTAPPVDIDVLQLLQRLWRRKLLLLLFLLIGISGAVLHLGNATYKYTAELTVTPADQNNAKVPGSVSSPGSLVGVDLGSQSGSSFALFADTVRSYAVAEVLAGNPKLMRRVFNTQWDEQAHMWR